jgi:hypothetical protein
LSSPCRRLAGQIAFQYNRVVYTVLFCTAAKAMRDIVANPRRPGAEVGAVAVLHTWARGLSIICICTASVPPTAYRPPERNGSDADVGASAGAAAVAALSRHRAIPSRSNAPIWHFVGFAIFDPYLKLGNQPSTDSGSGAHTIHRNAGILWGRDGILWEPARCYKYQ